MKWLKNGQEITPTERVRVEIVGTLYKLVLDNTQLTDADEYSCVLPDSKESKAKLTVQGNAQKPDSNS